MFINTFSPSVDFLLSKSNAGSSIWKIQSSTSQSPYQIADREENLLNCPPPEEKKPKIRKMQILKFPATVERAKSPERYHQTRKLHFINENVYPERRKAVSPKRKIRTFEDLDLSIQVRKV